MTEIKRLDIVSFQNSLQSQNHISAFSLALKIHEILFEGDLSAIRAGKRLDFLFHEFMAAGPQFGDFLEGISALNDFLFKEKRFKVVATDSEGEMGIFIGRIFERREGGALSFGLVYREMIRRLHVGGADFINFPGLCAVKVLSNHQLLILNPAEEGKVVSVAELQERLIKKFGKTAALSGAYLEAPSELQITSRFLVKLKNFYFEQRDWAKLLAVMDLLVCVGPGRLMELKERGLLLYQLGLFGEANEDLRHFISNSKPSQEVEDLRKLLSHLQKPPVSPLF